MFARSTSTRGIDGAAAPDRLQLSSSARLDLRDVGIRVPGFLVRRFVDVSVTAQATHQA
jgi:hypothetical protein